MSVSGLPPPRYWLAWAYPIADIMAHEHPSLVWRDHEGRETGRSYNPEEWLMDAQHILRCLGVLGGDD